MDATALEALHRFCNQYLQLESALDYPAATILRRADAQAFLFQWLFDAVKYQPPPRYQLKTLKELLARIEASIEDWDEHGVSDDLTGRLGELLAQPIPSEVVAVQQKCYVTYSLSLLAAGWMHSNLATIASSPGSLEKGLSPVLDPSITLLESRSLISGSGTTGFRTWEASLHLGQYLCSRPSLVQNRAVLELGAGTGYLSILCAKFLGAHRVVASDGSDDVINHLPDNFFLNDLQDVGDRVSAMDLKWGYALVGTEEQQWNGGRPVDVVLGADITYDQSVIPSLIATLEDLAALYPAAEMLIAATQRNMTTFSSFVDRASSVGFSVAFERFDVTPTTLQKGPFYNDATAIHICRLSKQKA